MLLIPFSLRPLTTFSAIAPTCRLARPVVTIMKSENVDLPRRSMVTVSSAFISSRRERIIFSVLSASGCAFKAAGSVDALRRVFAAGFAVVLETLGKTDLDNTDVARDHSFHCIANAESRRTLTILHYECGVNGFNIPVSASLSFCPPAAVRVPQPGG